MSANRPTCNWCGKTILGEAIPVAVPPATYVVHVECWDATVAYVAEQPEELSDGSFCVVEPIPGRSSSLISRLLSDGTCAWGQAFGKSNAVEHAQQVEEVKARMRANPSAYHRPEAVRTVG